MAAKLKNQLTSTFKMHGLTLRRYFVDLLRYDSYHIISYKSEKINEFKSSMTNLSGRRAKRVDFNRDEIYTLVGGGWSYLCRGIQRNLVAQPLFLYHYINCDKVTIINEFTVLFQSKSYI